MDESFLHQDEMVNWDGDGQNYHLLGQLKWWGQTKNGARQPAKLTISINASQTFGADSLPVLIMVMMVVMASCSGQVVTKWIVEDTVEGMENISSSILLFSFFFYFFKFDRYFVDIHLWYRRKQKLNLRTNYEHRTTKKQL